jgi:hypothetical protein
MKWLNKLIISPVVHKSEWKQSNDIAIKMHMDCMNHYATKALKGCVRLMKTM